MIKVKEFLNYQENQDKKINEWLERGDYEEIIDIKYSVGCFQKDDETNGWVSQEFSGVLIIYK